MQKYTAKDGDRLDSIVYEHYGTLDCFSEVLAFNTKLNEILKAGDVVLLPQVKIKEKRLKSLW